MTGYKITVAGPNIATLYENGQPLLTVDHGRSASSSHFVDDLSKTGDSVNCFEPTMEFWKELIEVNKYTADLATSIQCMNVPDAAIPDNEYWGIPYADDLPKYEARIAYDLAQRLFEARQETTTVFKEYPSLRRLFRHAYVEATGEVPEYLREFVN